MCSDIFYINHSTIMFVCIDIPMTYNSQKILYHNDLWNEICTFESHTIDKDSRIK